MLYLYDWCNSFPVLISLALRLLQRPTSHVFFSPFSGLRGDSGEKRKVSFLAMARGTGRRRTEINMDNFKGFAQCLSSSFWTANHKEEARGYYSKKGFFLGRARSRLAMRTRHTAVKIVAQSSAISNLVTSSFMIFNL